MTNYEIRIRKRDGTSYAYRTNRVSDLSAIRTASSIAAESDKVEVWRGMHCIYDGKPDSVLVPPDFVEQIFMPGSMNA